MHALGLRGLAIGVAVCAALHVAPTAAQDDPVTSLRARVSAAPDDVSLRCQLAFALVGASQHEEARTVASAAIAAVPRPLDASRRRLLGACLYNLGRAEEGLGHRLEASTAYVRSLAVRDNDAVRARLHTLVPEAPADDPTVALALVSSRPDDTYGAVHPSSIVRVGGDVFHFVPFSVRGSEGAELVLAVVVVREDAVAVATIESWAQEDYEARLVASDARAWSARGAATGAAGAMATVQATGGGHCDDAEGYADFSHTATVFASFDGTRVRTAALVTEQYDCEEPVSLTMQVRGTDVVVRRARHGSLQPGTYPIESLLR
ncbi:MAG: hypothetical protein U0353_05995 [Sandaracinus sp.]